MKKTVLFKVLAVILVLAMLATTFISCAKSAYEIAVENGFEGTEDEWLKSIQGTAGSAGSSIQNAYVDDKMHLILVMSDGSKIDAGFVGTYTVSFDLNYTNPTTLPPVTQTLTAGKKATLPQAPQRTGFQFGGWYTDASCTDAYDFDATVSENLILYARWNSLADEQVLAQQRLNELDSIQELNNGVMPEISMSNSTFTPSFIAGSYTTQAVTDFNSAVSSLNSVNAIMGFEDLASEFADAGTEDLGDVKQYRLQQTYAGYPVYGKQMVITTDNSGNTKALSGSYTPVASTLNSTIALTHDEAAVALSAAGYGTAVEDGILMIYTLNGYNEFAYIFETATSYVAVSAVDGQILGVSEKLLADLPDDVENMTATTGRAESQATDTFNTVYYETADTHIFYDSVRNIVYHDRNGQTVATEDAFLQNEALTDSDNIWTDAASHKAIELYHNLSAIYDFYLETLGLLSYDGNGGKVLAFINDGWSSGTNAGSLTGAYEDGEIFTVLTFGENVSYHSAIDVVAHEYTHSLQAAAIANLQYSLQTGALMEAYADIMGELIQLALEGTTDWVSANRNIADPALSDSPLKFNGARYYVGNEDRGGVHKNSTVISHALYSIFATVEDVEDMTELLFRAWNYLTPSASFYDYRMAMLAAARDMRMSSEEVGSIVTAFNEANIIPENYSESVRNPMDVTLTIIDSATSAPIPAANVVVKRPGNNRSPIVNAYCNTEGILEFQLQPGRYSITVTTPGYETYSAYYNITPSSDNNLLIRMNAESVQEEIVCELGGVVSNALTNEALAGVTMNFRKGHNITSGRVDLTLTTDAQGNFYTDDLDYGYYTIELVKEGFIVSYAILQSAASNWDNAVREDALNQNISISPIISVDDVLRIVLTWGLTPNDLDSHIVGKDSDRTAYHVFYSHKTDSVTTGGNSAELDIDDTTSYGPETITVYLKNQSGDFSYLVHDFTNKSSTNNTAMSNSGAKITVYAGNTLLGIYDIPTATVGTVWHVFDYDYETGTLITVNQFSNQSNASLVAPAA